MRGWSSTCPVSHASPVTCSMVCANPGRSRHGPSRPNAGIRTITARGLAACTTSQPRSNFSRTRGVKFSTTTSTCSISRSTSVAPSARVRSSVRSRLLVLDVRKNALHSHQSVAIGADAAGACACRRRRVTDSTWITSAPSAASMADADGPAHQAVRSTTLTPCSGSSGPWVAGGFGGRGTTVPVCSPRRGAGRGGGAASPSIRHGRRGTRNVPLGSSTSEPRAFACSRSATAGPSDTGATGIRSSAASATISAVVCSVVQSWMIPFHSSQLLIRLAIGAQNPSSIRSGRSIISRKLSNCVAGVGVEPDVAVGGRLDRRGLEAAARGLPGSGGRAASP